MVASPDHSKEDFMSAPIVITPFSRIVRFGLQALTLLVRCRFTGR